ncbi:uncharacterized protein LOC134203027 [Armigeres subalbatus]|uniref:uncharacterized protein LOC134203027 n=1 Tax=Armigeres subalbatus TaxID=124917 RepID=UPI002ED46F24
MRKFKRARMDSHTAVDSAIVARARSLRSMEAAEKSFVSKEMEACFPLHQMFLFEKKTIDDFADMFPYLIKFQGILIHQTFSRIAPACDPRPDYKGVLAKCLLYNSQRYINVEDEYIRALLRIYDQMPVRGVQRKLNRFPSTEMHAVEHLVRWIKPTTNGFDSYLESMSDESHPHIVCIAEPMKTGPLHVVLNRNVTVPVKTSIIAIDILFRSFTVFGVPVPSELIMLMDFLALVLYKTKNQSNRITVNKLAALFKEAAKAED